MNKDLDQDMHSDTGRSIPAQLGYLTKAVEDQGRYISNYIKRAEKTDADTIERLEKIENDISVYKTIIKVIKFAFYLVVLILSFKFGDIHGLWDKLS